jgi:FMN reductase
VIVGIGGTSRPDSTTCRALSAALRLASQAGAETVVLSSAELDLPPYPSDRAERTAAARRLVGEVARADGVLIATPEYQGCMSGLVKNTLDYLRDLREAPRPYLEGRPVGLLVGTEGGDSTGGAMSSLRSTVHALQGWPTPLGITLTDRQPAFDAYGNIVDPGVARRFGVLTDQMIGFAYAWSHLI